MSVGGKNLSWVGWCLIGAGLFVSAAVLVRAVPDLRVALHEPEILGLDERLTNVQSADSSWLIEGAGGRWGRYGWYLASREQGSLRIRLPVHEPGILRLRLWAYPAGPLSMSIVDGERVHALSAEQFDGEFIRVAVNGPCDLVVEATNNLPEEQLIFDRFAATWSDARDHLPALFPFVCALAVGMLGWGWIVRQRNAPHAWRLWIGCTLILTAAMVGWAQRWALLEIARGLPVDSDVVAYQIYARSLEWFTSAHGFYSGTFSEREPIHVAAINLWSKAWGDTFPAIRWYTVIQSVLLIIVTGAVVWMASGKWLLGTVAAWVMALNPAWIEESVRGMRIESESLLLLAVVSVWLWARGWAGAILLGGAIGVMALVRAPALSIALPLVWLGWLLNVWRVRHGFGPYLPAQWRWPQLGLASIVAVLLFLPHLHGLNTVHGDPSWPSFGYARWNANFEFPERLGTPGFPSVEEFARNPYAGPRITYHEYLFGLHSISTLIRGQIKGWIESTAYMSASVTPDLKDLIFLFHASGFSAVMRQLTLWTVLVFGLSLGLTAWGWLALWREPQYWWVPVLSLWGTWYVAYLYGMRLVEPFRHTGHVYPLLLFCLLWGGFQVYQWLRAFLINDAGPPSDSLFSTVKNRRLAGTFQRGNPHPK